MFAIFAKASCSSFIISVWSSKKDEASSRCSRAGLSSSGLIIHSFSIRLPPSDFARFNRAYIEKPSF